MADFLPGRQTMTAGVEAGAVWVGGQACEFIFGQGTQLFPNLPVAIYGVCDSRVVLDATQRWFEFSFRMDALLSGNAGAGWTDAGNYFLLEPQFSIDLINWSMGKFIPAPVPVVDLGGGKYEYWARCVHPQDSAVKSAQVSCKSGTFSGTDGELSGDSRNNPFTALTIAGVSRALGGFPYTMPADAARMTTDLQPFFPGASVTASSNILWEIIIRGVILTSFGQINRVSWPQYLVPDLFGNVVNPVNGAGLTGNFVNAAGVAIYTKAFARLRITCGTRYL